MRLILLYCLLGNLALMLPSCTREVAEPVPIENTQTFKSPILTGHESSEDLKRLLTKINQQHAALVSSLAANIRDTETSEVQTSLNWLTGLAVLGLLGAFVAMWVIGINKWDIGLALGMGGSIFVLQGLSWAAPYRYHIGIGMLVIGLLAAGVYLLRARDWKKVKSAIKSDGFQLSDLKSLIH